MATFALDEYTASSSQTDFTITFSYRKEVDVLVYDDGVLQTQGTGSGEYIFHNATTIRFGTAVTDGALVILQRSTSQSTRLVDYTAGALTEADLDTDSLQAFRMSQEAIDTSNRALGRSADGSKFDAETKLIQNVVDPVSDQDAATKKYINDTIVSSNADIPLISSGDAGKMLRINSGETVYEKRTPAQVRSDISANLSHWINVKDHGAVGDGATDDTVSLQAALDAVSSTGDTVYFPGTFLITSALTVKDNTVIQGDGFQASKIVTANDIVILQGGSSGTELLYVVVQDIQLNRTRTDTMSTFHVNYQNPVSCKFRNVLIDTPSGLLTTDLAGIHVRKTGAPSAGPFMFELDSCLIRNSSVFIDNVTDNMIRGCWLWGTERAYALRVNANTLQLSGSQLIGGPTNGAFWVDSGTPEGLMVDHCVFDGSGAGVDTGRGINWTGVTNSSITNTRIFNQNDEGIYLEDCQGIIGRSIHLLNNNKADVATNHDITIRGVSTAPANINLSGIVHSNNRSLSNKANTIAVTAAGATPEKITYSNYELRTVSGYADPPFDPAGCSNGSRSNITFYQIDVAASQSAQLLDLNTSTQKQIRMSSVGSVVGIVVFTDDARTAGTLSVTPFINGSTTGITATLDGSNATFDVANTERWDKAFVQGQTIDVRITTDGDWAPVTADISVLLVIEN